MSCVNNFSRQITMVICLYIVLLYPRSYAQPTSLDKEGTCPQENKLDSMIDILKRNAVLEEGHSSKQENKLDSIIDNLIKNVTIGAQELVLDKLDSLIDGQTRHIAETKELCSSKSETIRPDQTTTASPDDGPLPTNCVDIQGQGHTESGVYTVYTCKDGVSSQNQPIKVFCDLETDEGGWLVIQKRLNGAESFLRTWNTYKEGFGDIDKEFWLGNDNIHDILNSCGKAFQVRFDLEDFVGGTKFAKYSLFNITDESDKYRLVTLGTYSGNAGDAFTYNKGHQFTTLEEDNDGHPSLHCGLSYRGAWWHYQCTHININALYLRGPWANSNGYHAMFWTQWRGSGYSLKRTEMKIKPKT